MQGQPTLDRPISQACTEAQIKSPIAQRWAEKLHMQPGKLHRKDWEWLYILRVLEFNDMLRPGRRGVGFGVGLEPVTDAIVSHGVHVLATDLDPELAADAGWAQTGQHANSVMAMHKGYTPASDFMERVKYRVVDMTKIPTDIKDFDFTWSSCSLEHLGSLHLGLDFILNSLDTLKPGGIAVHTTEYNVSSNDDTIDTGWCVLYRRRDIEWLQAHLGARGHRIEATFETGDLPADKIIDVPPYKHDPHLKLQMDRYTITSFGIVIHKAA